MKNLPESILKNERWHDDTTVLNEVIPYIYLGLIKPEEGVTTINQDVAVKIVREVFKFDKKEKKKIRVKEFDEKLLHAPKRNKRIRDLQY